jgi:hypothetical protein
MITVIIPHVFMKMALNVAAIPIVQSNLSLLIYVATLLGLNAMMPLLKTIHSLIKFSQMRDVFACDFIAAVKICDGDVYHMFYDS